MAEEEGQWTLEDTPTWAVATVCFFLIAVSLLIEYGLQLLAKYFKKQRRKSLIQALDKIKSDLMLLGFISLFLTVCEKPIANICIPRSVGETFIPCPRMKSDGEEESKCEEQKLILKTNMRAQSDSTFSDFLLRVGNGVQPTVDENMIEIPEDMIVRYEGRSCESCLINAVFPSLKENANSAKYITQRAILATRNESVDMLNDKLIATFPGEEWKYVSYDEAIDDTHCYYPEEFLNTLTPNGLPPHELVLKVNSPIMLLRNLNPSAGLCNGTRMVCKGFERNVIHAEITLGQHAGKQVLLNRIPLLPAENDAYPFQFKRTQFPIRLCFAMTINKAQGQTIPNVGVYLPQPVFSHGQLYVALSRGISMSTTKVLIKAESKRQRKKNYTKNIVYKEVLTS